MPYVAGALRKIKRDDIFDIGQHSIDRGQHSRYRAAFQIHDNTLDTGQHSIDTGQHSRYRAIF